MDKYKSLILDDCSNIVDLVSLSPLINKKILITGGTGIVGTYLIASIISFVKKNNIQDIQVDFISKNPISDFHCEIVKDEPYIRNIYADLSLENFSDNLESNYDFVIHAAGYGQPGKFLQNPNKTVLINTFATSILLDKLKDNGKFLFISTSEIYSGNNSESYIESDIGNTTPLHPRAPYIESKRCGETLVNNHFIKHKNSFSARLALAYGPGTKKNDHRVLNNFIEKAIIHKEINLLDSGSDLRTYCYITDAVTLFWRILFFGKSPIYNVGGISEISILDLAKKIGEITNVKVNVPNVSKDDLAAPSRVKLNTELVESLSQPMIFKDLDYGLRKTIEWQKLIYSG